MMKRHHMTMLDARRFAAAYERDVATRARLQELGQYVVEGFAFGACILVVLALLALLQP